MLSRRGFVIGGAAVAGLVAAGGTALLVTGDRAGSGESGSEAWAQARGVDRIVLAATLAPSSHNTQPWRFRVSERAIDLLGDPSRTMGAADPRGRELHVSLGCALENMSVAAAAQQRRFSIERGVAGSAHFARMAFADDAEPYAHADLAGAIPARTTNRGPFDEERAVAPSSLETLAALADDGVRVVWLTGQQERERFTKLSIEATKAHVADATMQRDSHRWYRMDADEAEQHRDGITIRGANLPFVASLALGLFPPTPESFDEGWGKATADTHCGTAPAFGLLVVEGESDRGAWVAAGRAFQRMALRAHEEGISLHPISQALAIRDREVAKGEAGRFSAGLSGLGGQGEVVLAFRIGYPVREQAPALRRPPVVVA